MTRCSPSTPRPRRVPLHRDEAENPPRSCSMRPTPSSGPRPGDEDLRGLLDAGTSATGPPIATTPPAASVEKLETFAMAALAGIGAMPDTIEDRAVVIRMRRRAPGEPSRPTATAVMVQPWTTSANG